VLGVSVIARAPCLLWVHPALAGPQATKKPARIAPPH
jgi:hypothetical protein